MDDSLEVRSTECGMKSGQTLGHYKILRPLAKDGIGEVYLAEATKPKR